MTQHPCDSEFDPPTLVATEAIAIAAMRRLPGMNSRSIAVLPDEAQAGVVAAHVVTFKRLIIAILESKSGLIAIGTVAPWPNRPASDTDLPVARKKALEHLARLEEQRATYARSARRRKA